MTQTPNPIALAHAFADAAIFAEMRPGTANQYDCALQEDERVVRLGELYASEVLGTLGYEARLEMKELEDSLTNEM
ncbi:MAG: hypothetical protein ACLFR0_09345 [Alphaproteobacteria bacterium]